MRWLDRRLRDARFARAHAHVEPGDDIVDVGCSDGEMFRQWDDLIGHGVGLDPDLDSVTEFGRHELRPGTFPAGAADLADASCDVVTMLAVLEHVPTDVHAEVAAACRRLLRPGGRVVITVPSPMVDRILDGMHEEEHYGFDPSDTERIFSPDDFELVIHRRFQLGLNNLYVFRRR